MSLSQKIASKYLASQPLRLQPDYGEGASNLANPYAKRSADFLADDLFADDHEAEGWLAEKEADFDKYSRVKSHKHHSPKEVKDSYEAQKKNFGDEWAKYEGAMTEEGIEESVVQENLKEMGKSASLAPTVFIDDSVDTNDRNQSLAIGVVEKNLKNMRLDLPRGLTYEMINEAHLHFSPRDQRGPVYQVAVDMVGRDEDEVGRPSYDGTFFVLVQEGRVKKTSTKPFSMGKSASQMIREDFIDAKGKSGGLHDEIKVDGKKFFVSNIFYDLGRREIFVSYMDGRKQRSVPASEVVITKADPYRRASYDDEIIDDIGLGLMADGEGSYMSRQNLREIEDISGYVLDHIEDYEEDLELDDWVEDKISQGRSMMDDVYRHVTYGDRHQHQEDDEIIDDLGLDRMASDEIIDDIGLGRSLKRRRSF